MNPSVKVGGNELTDWLSVKINRSLDNLTGEFSLVMPGRPRQGLLNLNSRLEIYQNGERLMTGYAETIKTQTSERDSRTSISGRGLIADMIDASPPPLDYEAGTTLLTIAQKIAAAHNIIVSDPQGIAASTQITEALAWKPGETAAEALARAATGAETIIIENENGDLVFWRASAPTSLRLIDITQTMGVEQVMDMSGIFASYTIIGADATKDNDAISATATGGIQTRPNRNLIKAAAQAEANQKTCNALADWHMRKANAEHWRAKITMTSWRDDAQNLFKLGDGVKVIGAGDMPATIITAAIYTHDDRQGQRAQLSLSLPAAYTPQPPAELPENA